jgi:2'-phosphotransferase
MSRQHIHLAPALVDHRITPRPTSTLFIHLDLTKLLGAGIPVYTSTNGVVLTPGNKNGFVPNELWETAERVINGERVLVWEEGTEVVPDAPV